MDVMESRPQALDQREVEKAFLVFKQLPHKKRERVLKLIELLNSAECQDECYEVAKAIAEIIAKASGQVAPGGRSVDLTLGVSKKSKDTVAAYHGEIGKAIRKRREELKMTQEELAAKSGLPQSHISRLEAGKHAPTRQTIERVARALKTDPGKLDLLYD